MKNELKS